MPATQLLTRLQHAGACKPAAERRIVCVAESRSPKSQRKTVSIKKPNPAAAAGARAVKDVTKSLRSKVRLVGTAKDVAGRLVAHWERNWDMLMMSASFAVLVWLSMQMVRMYIYLQHSAASAF